MTFIYTKELSDLVNYDMIINDIENCCIDNIEKSIVNYCFFNENINVIKKVVETFGIFNSIKLYQNSIKSLLHHLYKNNVFLTKIYIGDITLKVSNIIHEDTYRRISYCIIRELTIYNKNIIKMKVAK
jgi:hypothetical protein